jgi:cytochrome c-type biogenesis protein
VSFLSPCVLPLVPGYLSTVVGVAPPRSAAREQTPCPDSELAVVASFSIIFVVLGVGATLFGSSFASHRRLLDKIAALLITALGVFFIATVFVVRFNRAWRVDALVQRARSGGPLLAGAAFALAWTPCVGPTLGAILFAAALSNSAPHGAVLLAFYSAGLAIPFLATALAFERMSSLFCSRQAPLPDRHRRRWRRADRDGLAHLVRGAVPAQHPGPASAEQPRQQRL